MSKKLAQIADLLEWWLSKLIHKSPPVVVYTAKDQRDFLYRLGHSELRHAISRWPPLEKPGA